MRIPRTAILLALIGFMASDGKEDDLDASNAFMEAAQALFADKDAVGRLQNIASQFMESDTGKQMGSMLGDGDTNSGTGGVGQILSGLGNLMGSVSNNKEDQSRQNGGGMNLPMLGSILGMLSSGNGVGETGRSKREAVDEPSSSGGFDFESMMNVAGMFLGEGGNAEGLMGLLPMLLENLSGGDTPVAGRGKKHDHSSHSWYMPPVVENLHVMWEHFSNSELGQTLWNNSGLENIVSRMTNENGRIKYEELLDSFENPTLRRQWIRSLTNFVADWFTYISDPSTQQRHLTTFQFVVNSFLKSQGFPKVAMFDATKPVESLTRIVNAGAKRRLNMQIDSQQYIKPAAAYIQDLMRLASEKGYIMSWVNANELSNRLSETINNDLVSPLLRAYRAYKWGVKSPKCASHVLCVINQRSNEIKDESKLSQVRAMITKVASYPAAWSISLKTGASFWELYGAIQGSDRCFDKYPVDCAEFHEEEIRVSTEATHNEL